MRSARPAATIKAIVPQRRFVPAPVPFDALEAPPVSMTRQRRLGAGARHALARVRGARLDAALASGADPARSPLLAARAAQLTSPRARARLAESLERVIARAQATPGPRRVAPQRSAVLAERDRLEDLAHALRGPRPVYAQGMAMLWRLLTDGTGPLFARRPEEALPALVEAVHTALRGGDAR
jgi:hypothetical protein